MIELDIPGFGPVRLAHLVTDFTGTLSVGGKVLPGVKKPLREVAEVLQVHVLTADTFGTVRTELEGVTCTLRILSGEQHDIQKREYIATLGAEGVVALGNGNNDREMLKRARIGIAVCLAEGCAVDAIRSADLLVTSPLDAFALLLNPLRLKATLRS